MFRLSPASSLSLLLTLAAASVARAQHEGHDMSGHDHAAMLAAQEAESGTGEILVNPLGSGTAWLPTDAPVHDHAVHFQAGSWMIMGHGEFFARYNTQNFNNPDKWPPSASTSAGNSLYPGLERGDKGFDFPNWAMVSAERPVFEDDRLMLRAMMSLDPLTVGREGYPLLLQTGEGLVDRQHSHDLFMELGLLYVHRVTENNRVFGYAALPGEPALGPVAFMHRTSIGGNPDAPLGHHSQDATHITYGVATLGWIYRDLKVDASAFNGREPDAERLNIEVGPLDSYSLRLSYNIGPFSMQGSGAWLTDPEPGEHGHVVRTTASIGHHKRIFANTWGGANWANTLVFGANSGHHGGLSRSSLRETSLAFKRVGVWGRWESLQRTGDELDLPAPMDEHFYWIHAVSAGVGGTLFSLAGLDVFLGGQGTFNLLGEDLTDVYGRVPLSAQVFLKVRPSAPRVASSHH
jgi:hypothetical protein